MLDFSTFSSLLRITAKYELPAVQPKLLEVVHDAYPETFERLAPTKALGDNIFSGPTPHPNEVLNLFVQQNLKSALPMAYYLAVRRGSDSLMDRCLPQCATLPPEILQSAIGGLMTLREEDLASSVAGFTTNEGAEREPRWSVQACNQITGTTGATDRLIGRTTDLP